MAETPPDSVVIDINSDDNFSSSVNSNPTNGLQENNQVVPRLRTQSFSSSLSPITHIIQHVPAVPNNNQLGQCPAIIILHVPAVPNNNQLGHPPVINNQVMQSDQIAQVSRDIILHVPAVPNNNQLGHPPVINNQVMQSDQMAQVSRDTMIAPNTGTSLGHTSLSLTYQAAIGFVIFYYQSLSSSSSSSSSSDIGAPLVPLHIVGIATVLGFTLSYIAIQLREAYPKPAAIVDKFGSASAALAFFVMTAVFLPSISQWIAWVAGICCFIAFVLALIKMR